MELDKVREIYGALPTRSKFVEVTYLDDYNQKRIRPGYFTEIFDMPLGEIPDEHKGKFGEGKEHPIPPYIVLHAALDRNQVPIEPLEIMVEKLIRIEAATIVPLKSS